MTTGKPIGRTFKEFEKDLTPAEKILLAACRQGKTANISKDLPDKKTAENTVRAEFVRFLALGGDKDVPVHEHGVALNGAWIEGTLQLRSAVVPSDLFLTACHFSEAPMLFGAKIEGTLGLNKSWVPGLAGDRLFCEGGLFLRDGFTSTGEVRLLGARIEGNLDCGNARFDGGVGQEDEGKTKYNKALGADLIVVKGSVYLRRGFIAIGEVRLLGARIDGNLDCGNATFDGKFEQEKGRVIYEHALSADRAVVKGDVLLRKGFNANGEVRLLGAQIGGNLECSNAKFDGKLDERPKDLKGTYALLADGIKVDGTFFFRKLTDSVEAVSLAGSHVRVLADKEDSWGRRLILDGFTYGSIASDSPTDAAARLAWLDKQSPEDAGLDGKGEKFKPQPWRQIIKVMREMGHAEDARQMAIDFEHRLRKAGLMGEPPAHWGKWRSAIYRFLVRGAHWLLWVFTGYGYRPLRLIGWMMAIWISCAMFYWVAAKNGVFAPSAPPVFQNSDYAACWPDDVLRPAHLGGVTIGSGNVLKAEVKAAAGNWYSCEILPEAYPRFSPLLYSLDVLLPPIDFQQNKNWGPMTPAPSDEWVAFMNVQTQDILKHVTRLVLWFEILFGWLSTGLLLAMVSGVMKRRED